MKNLVLVAVLISLAGCANNMNAYQKERALEFQQKSIAAGSLYRPIKKR